MTSDRLFLGRVDFNGIGSFYMILTAISGWLVIIYAP